MQLLGSYSTPKPQLPHVEREADDSTCSLEGVKSGSKAISTKLGLETALTVFIGVKYDLYSFWSRAFMRVKCCWEGSIVR